MKTTVETITPEKAKAYLEARPDNQRPLSKATVDKYARDMVAGKWILTHQGIAFNTQGHLVDGQHRLAAVVKSNASVEMQVNRGVAYEYGAPLDQGYSRRLGHILGWDTRKVATCIALRKLTTANFGAHKASTNDVLEVYEAQPEVVDTVLVIAGHRMLAGVTAAVAYAWPIDPDRCDVFLRAVRDGELLAKGDPAYAMRNWIITHRGLKGATEALLAACNCVRYELAGEKTNSVYTGYSGYRALTTRRRVLKIPNTPPASDVETIVLSAGDHGRDEERSRTRDPPRQERTTRGRPRNRDVP